MGGGDGGFVSEVNRVSKTFKTSAIFFFTAAWLVVMRLIMGSVNVSDNVSDWVFTFGVQVIGLGLIPILLYKFWVKESVVKGFSLRVKIHPLFYVLAIATGVVLHFLIRSVSVIWQTVAFWIGYTPGNSAGTIYSGPEVLVMSLLCTAVLPAICEETTYRGLGLQIFSTVKDEKLVILWLGLMFGLGHQFFIQTGYTFIAGLVFGFFIVKTRSIFPGMIIHFINNALSVVSEFSEQQNNSFYAFESRINNLCFRSIGSVIITLIVTAAIVAALLILVHKIAKNRKEDEKEENEDDATYFYPKTTQYVDELFGKGFGMGVKVVSKERNAAWYEYAFLYGAFALMILTTTFTFYWGFLR